MNDKKAILFILLSAVIFGLIGAIWTHGYKCGEQQGRVQFHREQIELMRDYGEAAILYEKHGKLKMITSTDEPTGEL